MLKEMLASLDLSNEFDKWLNDKQDWFTDKKEWNKFAEEIEDYEDDFKKKFLKPNSVFMKWFKALLLYQKWAEKNKNQYIERQNLSKHHQIKHTVNVGPYGTVCNCFDGKTRFQVGDGFNSGATYACKGGFITTPEHIGPMKQFAGNSHICPVTKNTIKIKYNIAKMCNTLKVHTIGSYEHRYRYLINFLTDQLQRWSYRSNDQTKFDALHDHENQFIERFAGLK